MLKWTTKTVVPDKGLDESTDELSLTADYALEMKNVYMDKDKSLIRRPGIAPLLTDPSPGGEKAGDVPKVIAAVGPTKIVIGKSWIWQYSDEFNTMTPIGPAPVGSLLEEDFYPSNESTGGHDIALGENVNRDIMRAQVAHKYAEVYDGGSFSSVTHSIKLRVDSYYSASDPPRRVTTGRFLDVETGTATNGSDTPYAPKVVIVPQDGVYVFWAVGTGYGHGTTSSLKVAKVDFEGNGQYISTISSDVYNPYGSWSFCPFDVVSFGSYVYVTYVLASTGSARLEVWDPANFQSGTWSSLYANAFNNFDMVSVAPAGNDLIWARVRAKSGANTVVEVEKYNRSGATLSSVWNTTPVTFTFNQDVRAVGLAERELGQSDVFLALAFEDTASILSSYFAWVSDLDGSLTEGVTAPNSYLTSAPVRYEEMGLVPVIGNSTEEPGWTTPALLRTDLIGNREPHLAGVWDFGLGPPGYSPNEDVWFAGSLPHPANIGDAWAFSSVIVSNFNVSRSEYIRNRVCVELDTSYRPNVVQTQRGCAAITGAVPMWYDGNGVSEMGIYGSPVFELGTAQATNSDDVSFVGIWSYVDGRGVIHRGIPGEQLNVPSNAGAFDVDLDTRSTPLTVLPYYQEPLKQLNLEVYVSGTVAPRDSFLRKNNDPSEIHPNNSSQVFPFTYQSDGGADSIIYTASGADLEAEPLNACTVLSVVGERMWAGGFARQDSVQYSDSFLPDVSSANQYVPEFNSQLSFQVPLNAEVKAIIDDKDRAMVLTEQKVYGFAGDGPDLSGAQNDFSKPVVISDDYGCLDQRTLVNLPDGNMFISDAGLVLLRGGQVKEVGNVEDTLGGKVIVDAFTVPERSHAVWAYNEDDTPSVGQGPRFAIYDYDHDAWFRWECPNGNSANPGIVSACWSRDDGSIYAITEDWYLYTEGINDAESEPVTGTWETAWMNFGAHNNLGKFTELIVNMDNVGTDTSVTITNSIRVGESGALTAGTKTFNGTQTAAATGADGSVQLKMHNKNPLCAMFKTRVEWTSDTLSANKVSSLTFKVGSENMMDPQANNTRGG